VDMIHTFNLAISDAVNKEDPNYEAIIGTEDYTPESIIIESSDFNCGALCNELEFLRVVSNYYVQSLDIDIAENENLNTLINAFLNLPRRDEGEADSTYRNRFRAICNQQLNPHRTTRWAILNAISYFVSDASLVQLIEPEGTNLYFQIRLEGTISEENLFYLDTVQGYLDHYFIGGVGIGYIVSFLGDIIDRIKAAGVDYDILFINQSSIEKTSSAMIGSVQIYKSINATIKGTSNTTKSVDATVI
jgi:hypothetical protein